VGSEIIRVVANKSIISRIHSLLLSTGGSEAAADHHLALNGLVGNNLGILLGLSGSHGHHTDTGEKERRRNSGLDSF
jgi:hypothetical protein